MYRLWLDTMMLGFEAQQVIWLRTLRLATGGKSGKREARRMVMEKVIAGAQASGSIAAGANAESVVRGYRKKVAGEQAPAVALTCRRRRDYAKTDRPARGRAFVIGKDPYLV